MNNEETLKKKTKKSKIAFYIAVVLGLLFFAFSFIAWNNAVKETVNKQTLEEQITQEERARYIYITRMNAYFQTEDKFEEIAKDRGYGPGHSPQEGEEREEFIEFLDQFVVMEKEKTTYMRNVEPPILFSVSQAKNINASVALIIAIGDLKTAIVEGDEKAIKDAEGRISKGFEDLNAAELSFKTAVETSKVRLDEKRKELE